MASCGSTTSKIFLTVIGFIFWGAAAALIFLGAWVYHTYNHFSELTTASLTLVPAGIVIIVGVFLFILGCVGCVGACKENKCILAVFFSLLLIVLTAEVTAGVCGYVFRKELHKAVNDGLENAVNKYGNDSSTEKDQIDYLQSELKCCGIMNASDWKTAQQWKMNMVPSSCCNVSNITSCDRTIKLDNKDIYKDGCLDKLERKFERNLVYIAGVAITFAVIQLLGMICSCILLCRSQEVRYEILGGPNSGLRV
ncbi:tetraspanin-3-like [Ruditapes philippinarum]|uniref:tetraspanin-3-like n=1 Tax=Ruditapes philippinarum TaxID=129788 RepID=UPI00295BCF64|nr:tetraspanin-3-like [Ruditapes philippinarum]